MNGAEVLCRTLQAGGAGVVFGVPGTQNLELFEALRRSSLRTVLATHELSASFMANGYSRISGKPGILTTIPGPGFTLALTGIAEARHDSAPLIVLVQVNRRSEKRRFDLQAIDHGSMASEILKGHLDVACADAIPGAMTEASRVALSGEPGPVLVEVSRSAMREEVRRMPKVGTMALDVFSGHTRTSTPEVESAVQEISLSRRLLILVGQGARGASTAVRSYVMRKGAVVVANSSGRGVVPEDDPHSVCGDFSGWAVDLVNELVAASDLVLALGYKFSHNGSSGYQLKIPADHLIHVDASQEVLDGEYPSARTICADTGRFVGRLIRELEKAPSSSPPGWTSQEMESWKARFTERRQETLRGLPHLAGRGKVRIGEAIRELRNLLPRDAVLVTDSGLHQNVVRRFFEVREEGGMILPSDFQSMGFGLPAGIGAVLAAPQRKVVVVTGDGGLAMVGLELATAVREKLDLTVLVFNDGHLGLIRSDQLRRYGHAHATRLGQIDFRALADATGTDYLSIGSENLATLEDAFLNHRPTLVDLMLSEDPSMRGVRARTMIRAQTRRVLGRSLVDRMKRWARRAVHLKKGRRS